MAVVIDCPSCALQFPARSGAAGQPQRCPRCGTVVGAAGPVPTASEPAEAAATEQEYRCSACGGGFDVEHVYDDGDGRVICHGCHERRAAGAAAAVSVAATPGGEATPRAAPVPSSQLPRRSAPSETAQGGSAAPSGAGVRPVKKAGSGSTRWVIAGGVVGAVAALVVGVIVMRPASPTGTDQTVASDGDADAGSAGPGVAAGPETNLQRVNRLWREARDRTKRRDSAGAAKLYTEMFDAIESDPAISGNRSLMADLNPARKEWQLANDIAGLPPLPKAAQQPEKPAAPKGGSKGAGDSVQGAGAAGDEASPDPGSAKPEKSDPPKVARADAGQKRATDAPDGAPPARKPVSRGVTKAAPRPKPAGANPAAESQVAAILDDADRLNAGGDKAAALARYTEAFRAAGDRSALRDAGLRKRLAQAVTTRAALIGQLRGGEGMRKMTLDALMEAGGRALQAGKWEAALDSLADARQVVEERTRLPAERAADPHYIPALHGLAVAYLKLNRNPKAGELFDEKAPLGKASLTSPDRALVWNRAVIDMIQKYKIMRAVKGLKEHFDRNPDDNPEEMVNLFGTALYIAYQQFEDDEKKPPPLLVQAIAVYERREQALEAARPGEKRWGVRWIQVDDFNRKIEETRRIEGEIQQLRGQLADAKRRLAVAERGRPVRNRRGRVLRYVVDQGEVAAAKGRVKDLVREIKAARARIPQRDWLATYDPVVPAIGPQTALASAGAAAQPPSRGNAPGGAGGGSPDAMPPFEPAPEPAPPEPGPGVADATPTPAAPAPPGPAVTTVRRVQRYAAAFPVDRLRLITAAAPLGAAETVFVEDSQGGGMRARVVAKNEHLALLEVDPDSVSGGMPFLNLAGEFAGGALRCAGLPSPTLFGPAVETVEGRAGKPGDAGWTVSLPRHPRLAGAPLLDVTNNTLVGVVVAARDDPATQLPAVGVAAVRAFLTESDALPAAACANPDPTAVYQVTIEE